MITGCQDRDSKPQIETRTEFWILKNYVRAENSFIHCHETVTFATHATVDYLDHLEQLVVQWRAPISLAIHAPGTDFDVAINSISYLRKCLKNSDLIKTMVTFHIFFSFKHFPKNYVDSQHFIYDENHCVDEPPYRVGAQRTFMIRNRLLYPINIGRNVARDAALTHFVLSSDIDFYPSPNLATKFLNMIAKNEWPLNLPTTLPKVFPLALFQIVNNTRIPSSKMELKEMLANKSASTYSDKLKEAYYPNIPNIMKWIDVKESDQIHAKPRKSGEINELWSPVYIGTHDDPHYDERLSWEGQNDRISQAYIMCVQNYRYLILDDVFLVHSSNFKPYGRYGRREDIVNRQLHFYNSFVRPQLEKVYGTSSHCSL
ncbi:glycosyl-transferase for dystroglycan domain-containing protein [Phthorimaea operculella]|nr:glycosyl-transferase for dystroglycan domain-containing protein [Phthorimaea operculella]